MIFQSLFSGSSGNCLLVTHQQTGLLIDAGISGKKIEAALSAVSLSPEQISGILVTHEHKDHIHGVGILSRRYDLPIYANPLTWQAMMPFLGKIDPANRRIIENNRAFDINDLEITGFSTSHDAADPIGFVINDGIHAMAVATDTGKITDDMHRMLSGKKLVVLESNHDIGMLETGPYPFPLKRRIRGEFGHLSNQDAGNLACELIENGTEHLILAHLSAENNYPFLAYQATERALNEKNIFPGKDLTLEVAERSQISNCYQF